MTYICIAILCLLAIVLEKFSVKNCFRDVWLDMHYSSQQVEPDELFYMSLEIENRSWIPKLFMQVSAKIPEGFAISDEEWKKMYANTELGATRFSVSFYMLPHQKMKIQIPLIAKKEGDMERIQSILPLEISLALLLLLKGLMCRHILQLFLPDLKFPRWKMFLEVC